MLTPAASVYVPEATSMVVAPSAVGVNVAVYTVDDVCAKLLIAPLLTEISAAAKFVVASLEVKVIESVASLEEPPEDTSAAVIVIVGAPDTSS